MFCANDVVAFGALDAARRLQLEVPGFVSIAGFDDIPMASWDAFGLTTVRQPLVEMARDAAAPAGAADRGQRPLGPAPDRVPDPPRDALDDRSAARRLPLNTSTYRNLTQIHA